MVTLTWARINEIADVVLRLSKDGKADPKQSYRAARIFAKGKSEVARMQEAQKAVYEKHQAKDENGKFKFDEHNNPVWAEADGAEKVYKEIAALMETTKVDVKIHPFEYEGIKHLTGADLLTLEGLVEGVPEEI